MTSESHPTPSRETAEIAGQTSAAAVHAGWNECVRNVFSLTDQTADETADKTGDFERGRRFEAKSIAKAMGGFGPEHCEGLRGGFVTSASSAAPESSWQPIETAPHTRKVLASYLNRAGKRRIVMACYYEEGELLMSDSYTGDEEFAAPGWYEECETAEETIYPVEGDPDLWHEIPTPPTIARATGDQQS